MNIKDEIWEAFSCCHDLEELKKTYMQLVRRFHPDKGGSVEACQLVNSIYDQFQKRMSKPRTDKAKNEEHHQEWEMSETFREMIMRLTGLPGLKLEICGSWLWATGDTWSNRAQLKESGMKYASKKKAWYYHETEWHRKGRQLDMDEIRERHGSETIQEKRRAQIA